MSRYMVNVPPLLYLRMVLCLGVIGAISGCASLQNKKSEFHIEEYQISGNPNQHKNIFVYFDGTANDPKSKTNVWRLYSALSKNGDPQATGIYIEGVGNKDEQPILGMALGKGMEERILRGYEFITKNYNPGDDVYIFGFSRGAHQARDLAGFLAYAGVPKISADDSCRLMAIGNDILELTKGKSDKAYLDKWRVWKSGQQPMLADEIKGKLNLEMRAAEVKFLGVWDTVPGSSFKKFGVCKEKDDVRGGDRYKSDSYPTIHNIAHAVSLDEKRSKFAPLLLCPAINPFETTLSEAWFPGAHADIGGGYEDSNELSGVSYNWMVDILAKQYKLPLSKVDQNAKGLAHWSIGDPPANIGSVCADRIPPKNAEIHASYLERNAVSPVPIRVKSERRILPYPITCDFHFQGK